MLLKSRSQWKSLVKSPSSLQWTPLATAVDRLPLGEVGEVFKLHYHRRSHMGLLGKQGSYITSRLVVTIHLINNLYNI